MSSIVIGIIMILLLLVFAWPRSRSFFSRPSRLILSIVFVVTLLAIVFVVPEIERYGSKLSNVALGSAGLLP